MSEVFLQKGRESLLAQDYMAAKREFNQALNASGEHHHLSNRITSFLGLAQVLTSDRNGLLLCRDAAGAEVADADVYLNLACAEWHLNNRKRAFEAITRGREIDARHPQLLKAAQLLDARRKVLLPFLKREHVLNRLVGRMWRKRPVELTVHTLLS